jgi:hypothetical protein
MVDGKEARVASPSLDPSRPSRSKAASVAIWSHKDAAIFVIGVIGAGAASLVGVFAIPRLWTFLCCSAIAAMVALVVRSLGVRSNKQRINALRLALLTAVVILAGAVVYHQWFDPARASQSSYPLQVGGTDVQIAQPSDAPGSPPGYDYPPVAGGSTVQVSC